MTSDFHGESSSQGFTSDRETPRDFQSSINLPSPPTAAAMGDPDREAIPLSPVCSSHGAQTLATIRQKPSISATNFEVKADPLSLIKVVGKKYVWSLCQ